MKERVQPARAPFPIPFSVGSGRALGVFVAARACTRTKSRPLLRTAMNGAYRPTGALLARFANVCCASARTMPAGVAASARKSVIDAAHFEAARPRGAAAPTRGASALTDGEAAFGERSG